MAKAAEYAKLVIDRKRCHRCVGLTNPQDVENSRWDSDHIGPWSCWQGNLDAKLMVAGQDWGDTADFVRQAGQEGARSPTNLALVQLIRMAGIVIGSPRSEQGRHVAFFTNAILRLKNSGGLQGKVSKGWFNNCTPFLRRQIEIVHPRVVVGLGQHSYEAILAAWGLRSGPFRSAVEESNGTLLLNGPRAFAVYHCGARIRNTHRKMHVQEEDWRRIRPFLLD